MTPIFYHWKIISIQPLNSLQLYQKIFGGEFRATLIFQKIRVDSEPPEKSISELKNIMTSSLVITVTWYEIQWGLL